MNAQGQSIFYEKAVKENMAKTLLAKLAYQTALFYNNSYNYYLQMTKHVDSTWGTIIQSQEKSFLASAHFHQGVYEEEMAEKMASNYGMCLARYRVALQHATEAKALLVKVVSPASLSSISTLITTISARLTAAVRNNNTVYLDTERPAKDLAPLEGLNALKGVTVSLEELIDPTKFSDEDCALQKKMVTDFDRLIPSQLRNLVNTLKQQTYILLGLQESVTEKKEEKKGGEKKTEDKPGDREEFLKLVEDYHSWGRTHSLPYSVEDAQKGKKLPDALREKIIEYQSNGGYSTIIAAIESLDLSSKDSAVILREIRETLEAEYREDMSAREKFGVRWDRAPSPSLTGHHYQALNCYQHSLEIASGVNGQLRINMEKEKQTMELFNRSVEEIEKMIPGGEEGGEGGEKGEKEERRKWRARVRELWAKNEEREKTLKEGIEGMKKMIEEDCENYLTGVLLPAFHENKNLMEVAEQFHRGESGEKRRQKKEEWKNQYEEWKKDCEGIKNLYQEGCSFIAKDTNAANGFFTVLETATNTISNTGKSISEGIVFFNNLTSQLRTLKQQVTDFYIARTNEKQQKEIIQGRSSQAPTIYPFY